MIFHEHKWSPSLLIARASIEYSITYYVLRNTACHAHAFLANIHLSNQTHVNPLVFRRFYPNHTSNLHFYTPTTKHISAVNGLLLTFMYDNHYPSSNSSGTFNFTVYDCRCTLYNVHVE